MNSKDYEYDVALSFLQQDEELATKLNDLLQDRVSTFLYSRKQETVAGTDGEKTFNRVFGSNARIVVVLYRSGWGSTPWTRIEETAIQNRAFDEGYNFVILIPLEHPPQAPPYFPKTRIWIGLERWGLEGAASAVEARVQEAGGMPHEETVEERAARFKRQIEAEQDRKRFLNSHEGVKAAREETENLFTAIDQIALNVSTETGFEFNTERWPTAIEVRSGKFCLSVDWFSLSSFTLNESRLDIAIWKGPPPRYGRLLRKEPRRYSLQAFHFDTDWSGQLGWREGHAAPIMSSRQLAEFCIKLLIDQIYEDELRNGA